MEDKLRVTAGAAAADRLARRAAGARVAAVRASNRAVGSEAAILALWERDKERQEGWSSVVGRVEMGGRAL